MGQAVVSKIEEQIEMELVELANSGTPFVLFGNKSKSAEAFMKIVSNVKGFVGGKIN